MTLIEQVAERFGALVDPGATCLVAVSGGPDSVALLDLLHRGVAVHGRTLVVGHVDHGIDPASVAVAAHVAALAAERGCPFVVEVLALGTDASETRARTARRAALVRMADAVGAAAIATGHHADDQAETVLLRVLRGSGPAGLAAMRLRQGRWIRPLLDIRRVELEGYLASRGLTTWNDPANRDVRHLRSWLRHEVMPTLVARLPDLTEQLVGVARRAGRARTAWDAVPDLIPALDLHRSAGGISVAAPPLRGYRSAVRDAIVAALGRQSGVTLGARRLREIGVLVMQEGGSRRIRVDRCLEVELAFDRLTFLRADVSPFSPVPIEGRVDVAIGDRRVEVREAVATGSVERRAWETEIAPGRYVVRPWQPADRIRPVGGAGSKAVATLFKEARVAPSRRVEWPVVTAADDATIVWVPGICRSGTRLPQRGTEALHVRCTDP